MTECPLRAAARDLAECSVCFNYLRVPRELTACKHVFCTVCIQELLNHGKGNAISCPQCRGVTKLQSGDVTDLAEIFYLRSLADTARLQGTELIPCSLCDSASTHRCIDCQGDWLCVTHAADHMKQRMSRDHQLLTLEEVRSETTGPVRHAALCAEHKEVLKFFCTQCKKSICVDCKVLDHNTHDSCLLSTHVQKIDAELQSLLEPLAAHVEAFSSRLEELENKKNSIEDRFQKHIVTWEESKKELLQLIERRDIAIRQEVTTQLAIQTAEYTRFKHELEAGQTDARLNKKDKDARYRHGSNMERLQLHQQLQESSDTPPAEIKLPPVSLSLRPDTTWLDFALVPPRYASLLLGEKATTVNGEWARRTRRGLGGYNRDPINYKVDSNQRDDHQLMEASLACLMRYQPYPEGVDTSACKFPAFGPMLHYKRAFPIPRPVQFQCKLYHGNEEKWQNLIWDLDESLCEAFQRLELAAPRSVYKEVACDVPLRQLMSRPDSPLPEFNVLGITMS